MYDIQSRWKLEGNILRYYGLRNQPNMFKNAVKLTKNQKMPQFFVGTNENFERNSKLQFTAV